jgi:enoyl-CoA hydratase/carnithine racemase
VGPIVVDDNPVSNSILYEKCGHVATITMNRPEALNAITVDMIESFADALFVAEADNTVRALILTGAGRVFCVGADIRQLKLWREGPNLRERFSTRAPAMFLQLAQFPRPIIAAVNGVAAAGGFELCCCADLVIAAEDAMIGDAHANFVGFGPISAVLASQVMPQKLASELLLTGDMWSSRRLEQAGFVNRVVPPERVIEVARACCQDRRQAASGTRGGQKPDAARGPSRAPGAHGGSLRSGSTDIRDPGFRRRCQRLRGEAAPHIPGSIDPLAGRGPYESRPSRC